jgi:hypothetical protein
MHTPKQHRERILPIRQDHQMHMIRHQAICLHPHFGIGQIVVQQRKIQTVVRRRKKDPFMIRPALRDMIGESGLDTSGISGHSAGISAAQN